MRSCNVSQDLEVLKNLVRRMDSNDATNAEQLLPDFYAEHVTLAMNRERRKQALVRVLHLIRQDLERERRGREGLETLHRAFIKTPAFAADESTQNVTDKLHHVSFLASTMNLGELELGIISTLQLHTRELILVTCCRRCAPCCCTWRRPDIRSAVRLRK